MNSILQSGDFADITIKCGHTEIKAHSVIISARSDFFRAACQGPWKVPYNSCLGPSHIILIVVQEAFTRVIELPEDDSKVCNTLLQFMYTGDYVVDKETEASCVEACHFHSEIFLAAKKYNIKFLPEVAECRLKLKVLQSV